MAVFFSASFTAKPWTPFQRTCCHMYCTDTWISRAIAWFRRSRSSADGFLLAIGRASLALCRGYRTAGPYSHTEGGGKSPPPFLDFPRGGGADFSMWVRSRYPREVPCHGPRRRHPRLRVRRL